VVKILRGDAASGIGRLLRYWLGRQAAVQGLARHNGEVGNRMSHDWFEESVTNGIRLGWISPESHLTTKRMNALRNARQRMDRESQEFLPPMVIFMPTLSQGQTMRREILPGSIFVWPGMGMSGQCRFCRRPRTRARGSGPWQTATTRSWGRGITSRNDNR